ncbi:MAG: AMP-dependent synthetase/ligase [Cyanophyceae cyanobacterium]
MTQSVSEAHPTASPRADYSATESMPQIWSQAAKQFGDVVALRDPHAKPEVTLTYAQLDQQIQQFAAGLQALGVQPEAKVALVADNSPRWLIADQGIMAAGAVDVVRSSAADSEELLYIIENSDSTGLVVEDSKTLEKLRPQLDELPIGFVVLLSDATSEDESLRLVNFEQLLNLGTDRSLEEVPQQRDSLATLLYTSGTTGKPKGVMLSHGNLLHQVNAFKTVLQARPGDRFLSILPSWHAYERSCEYFLLSQGCTLSYTNIRAIKKDLKDFKPHYLVGVPRLWESIYEGIQKQFREQPAAKQKLVNFLLKQSENYVKVRRTATGLNLNELHASAFERLAAQLEAATLQPLHALADRLVYQKVREATGGNVRVMISGGGSLARHLDDFYEIIGVTILVGYGLTETSPVTNVRRFERNLRGSAGPPLVDTEIRIADPQTRQPLPAEQRGVVLIRGPQVMQGYYKLPEATAKAIDKEGWFDSGDLGWVTPANDLVLTGRAKDTIVLTNGENIEPQPIEDACARSSYIDQIMVVGQDQRSLGALIVPNLDALQKWAQEQSVSTTMDAQALNSKPVRDLFRQELNREVKDRPGYRADDRIGPFEFILEPFSIEDGTMTQTLKVKRPVVKERYHDIINRMFE